MKKVTLEELAKRTNVSASFLSKTEKEIVRPSVESVKRIAALYAKLDYFFKEEKVPQYYEEDRCSFTQIRYRKHDTTIG
ncbi:MAG: helix-turn-helix domain-containing protein [bacterium]